MATRKEEKEAARAERQRKQEEAAKAEARRRKVGYAAGGALVLAAIVALAVVLLAGGGDDGDGGGGTNAESFPARSTPLPQPPADATLKGTADKAGCTYKQQKDEGSEHTQDPVTYKTVPPNSGDHNPQPADDGAYTESPGIEHLVHSLEHGRIILWYPPDAPDTVKADLKALFDEDPAHMIIAPLDNLGDAAAASAWTQTLNCPKWSDDAINAMRVFRDNFRDQGPEFAA